MDLLKKAWKYLKTSAVPSNRAGFAAECYSSRNTRLQLVENRNILYVILPYFNYCRYKRRLELFLEFIERIRGTPGIRIVVSELGDPDFQLPDKIPGVYMHVRNVTKHAIWLKENIINLAVARLPSDWRYMAWIDADLTFINPDWPTDTIRALSGRYDIIQLFDKAHNLGPDEEVIKIDRGFGYMHIKSGRPFTKKYTYGFWHPGYAWACHRVAYDTMAGLIDWGILGSGDHHMALGLIGLVHLSHPGGIHVGYSEALKQYERRVANLRLGYIPGTILHHFHGSLKDRRYQERWEILTQGKYNPMSDIGFDQRGVIQLTEKGERLAPAISAYFYGRNEDG